VIKEFPLSGDDCRAHAKRHREAANKVNDPLVRERHLVLAAEYDKLAVAMEALVHGEADS
jgi:hypothetical protein